MKIERQEVLVIIIIKIEEIIITKIEIIIIKIEIIIIIGLEEIEIKIILIIEIIIIIIIIIIDEDNHLLSLIFLLLMILLSENVSKIYQKKLDDSFREIEDVSANIERLVLQSKTAKVDLDEARAAERGNRNKRITLQRASNENVVNRLQVQNKIVKDRELAEQILQQLPIKTVPRGSAGSGKQEFYAEIIDANNRMLNGKINELVAKQKRIVSAGEDKKLNVEITALQKQKKVVEVFKATTERIKKASNSVVMSEKKKNTDETTIKHLLDQDKPLKEKAAKLEKIWEESGKQIPEEKKKKRKD